MNDRGLDPITRGVLEKLSATYPGHCIYLSHQFLDGEEGKACGLMLPLERQNGMVLCVMGKWWGPVKPEAPKL